MSCKVESLKPLASIASYISMRLTIISYHSFMCAKIQSFPESSNFFMKKSIIPFHYRNLFVFLQMQSVWTAKTYCSFPTESLPRKESEQINT